MHSSIFCFSIIDVSNSTYDPTESAIKEPRMHPYALSSKELALIELSILFLV